ncbi:MAG TPA: aminomethyl-transferring glycine dehydrogenase subunit GcvPA [Candidatus Lokiarchaeia archaeon]|nr:aminomethyl-transferring glycine dehydrogenase subunit GcvPA [Candidatus Lokiarchaeia archaeon]
MDYIPNTDEDIQIMLKQVGVRDLVDLFDTVPQEILLDDMQARKILKSGFLGEHGMTELELKSMAAGLASRNKVCKSIFQGAGCYWHYIPASVDYLVSRGEFWTSYTPYQAERSQGYLQAIFEYQSMITELTGMKFSNASLHDGATSLVDAIIMAQSQNKKRTTIMFAGKINPIYMTAVATALSPRGFTYKHVEPHQVIDNLDESVLAVIACSPDFFGNILDVEAIARAVKERDPNIIVIQCIAEALSLAILKSPGAAGVDIAVGEAQSLGIPMSFGGPSLGFLAVADTKLLHKMPGRIVGATREIAGDGIGFTLTLTAREQHIRREKSLSNICSNEALNMLRAVIHVAALGATGLVQAATINVKNANYLKHQICQLEGFTCMNDASTFNEFVIKVPESAGERIAKACEAQDLLGPLNLGTLNLEWKDMMLFCTTEMNDVASMDRLVNICTEASS